MFSECSSIINLSNFNNNNVTDMSYMLYGCSSLTIINLSNFNTNNIIDMSYMFDECSSLTEINLNNFNTLFLIELRQYSGTELSKDCALKLHL